MSISRTVGLAGFVGLLVAGAPAAVAADDTPAHPASGTWTLSTSESALRATLDKAVDDVAQEFNFVIREIARHKLQGATKVCKTYALDVQAQAVTFACDGKPPAVLPRDGSPLRTQNDAGEPITGTAKVTASGVVVTWKGEVGARTNTFTATEQGLRLAATVTGDQMPKPLKWTVDYRK